MTQNTPERGSSELQYWEVTSPKLLGASLASKRGKSLPEVMLTQKMKDFSAPGSSYA